MRFTLLMSHNSRHSQQGSMLVISIFVIVVMAALGLTMTRLLSTSSESVVYEVYGLRAMNAARSGIQRSIYQTFAADSCVSVSSSADFPGFSAVDGVNGCAFVAQCGQWDIDGMNYYRFTSTGQCTIDDIVISRTIAVDARDL